MGEMKDKEMKSSPKTVKVLSDAMVSIKVSMPMRQWVEWDNDCKQSYGDVRWMKLWHDHVVNKDFMKIEELFKKYGEVTNKEVNEVVKEKLGTFNE